MGVALLGAMMARRTSDRLAEVVPARVRELLPEGWLDLANATRLLVDPSASATLSKRLSASGSSGAELAQEVAGYAGTALGGALSDTFLLGAAVASVSVVVAFFMLTSGSIPLPPSEIPGRTTYSSSGVSAGRVRMRLPCRSTVSCTPSGTKVVESSSSITAGPLSSMPAGNRSRR